MGRALDLRSTGAILALVCDLYFINIKQFVQFSHANVPKDKTKLGSNPTRGKSYVTTLGKLFTPMCFCHQAV